MDLEIRDVTEIEVLKFWHEIRKQNFDLLFNFSSNNEPPYDGQVNDDRVVGYFISLNRYGVCPFIAKCSKESKPGSDNHFWVSVDKAISELRLGN